MAGKAYAKNTWTDEVLSGSERYDIKENAGTGFKSNMQIVLATPVTVAGSDVNATRMNNIENGIDALDTKLADANDLLTTGGTSTAFTLTTTGAAALATGERFRVKFNATAGATPTLNRDSKGAKSLKYYDSTGTKQACTSTNIIANLITDVVYDGTDYVVLDPAGVGGGGAWGGITGTLSSQTDLQAALDAKISNAGWVSGTGTWSYSSADSPIFVISINADMTAILQAGMRIKLTQTTTKYFIIHAVGAYSGGATLITVYGGTDYTLANAAITNPYYSNVKAPFGFPMAKSKWTVAALNDSTNRSQSSPTSGTVYNLGSLSFSIPIGEWELEWKVTADVSRASAGGCTHYTSLSTANNTINTAIFGVVGATGTTEAFTSLCVTTKIAVAAKTTYYVTAKTVDSSISSITHYNSSVQPETVNLTSVYL